MAGKIVRVGLVLLGLIGLQVGAWASAAPRSFYDDFPGGGRSWVAADGPYNEHLVRDFGALNLALTAVVVVALVTWTPVVVRTAGLAWLVYSLPHLAYHVRHRHIYDTSDQVLNLVGLGGAVVVAAAVLVVGTGGTDGTSRTGGRRFADDDQPRNSATST